MSRAIEIIDPEGQRRLSRQRKIFALFVLISLSIFGYPEAKDYAQKWNAQITARILAEQLTKLRNRAMLEKLAYEAKFQAPDIVEINQVSSCGPNADRKLISRIKLSDWRADIEFAPEPWVRSKNGTKEPVLQRYCYDPQFGSSIHADGLSRGGIFLAHRQDLTSNRGDHLVELAVEGITGDLSIESIE